MAATELSSESAPTQEGLLTVAARTVGHAAGKAAKAMGLDQASVPGSKTNRNKTGKPLSARARRKDRAEDLKSKGASLLSKNSADLGAPYRRVMGKPAANWSDKDIDYVRRFLAKHGAPS